MLWLSYRKAIEEHRLSWLPRLLASSAIIASLSSGASSVAQQTNSETPARSVFVEQAPLDAPSVDGSVKPPAQPRVDRSSKVYFPDEITPEAVAAARAQALRQDQLKQAQGPVGDRGQGSDVSQVSQTEERGRDVEQLSDGRSAEMLAQLTPAQREVLIDAVEGTDICEREQSIPALRALCEDRLEDRSSDFTQSRAGATAADAILGESLDSDRVATLEAAIARLARASASTDGVDDSVIASVAFTNQTIANNQAAADSDPANDLSPDTQALVNAIVQQLGGP